MWAYFVKDVKENARWGLLAAVLLTGLLAYLLYKGPRSDGIRSDASVVGAGYLTGAKIGFAAAGLSLGLVLALPDRRRGHWGFAVHRPIERWKIFTAKTLAGVALYATVGGLAMLVTILVAMTPRIVWAPFAGPMMIPTLYFFLAGLMWGAAGLLVGFRQARWIGSRTFPVLAVGLVSSVVDAWAVSADEALLADAAVVMVLLAAGAASLAYNGDDELQPRAVRTPGVLTIGLGTFAGLMLIATILGGIGNLFNGYAETTRSQYLFDLHGRPYRALQDNAGSSHFDLQGNRIRPSDEAWLEKNSANVAYLPAFNQDDATRPRRIREARTGFLEAQKYLTLVGYGHSSDAWYFVRARRTIELLDDDSGLQLGSIGPSGFRPGDGPAEPFPADAEANAVRVGIVLIQTGSTVLQPDLERRSIRTLFSSPDGGRVLSARLLTPQTEGDNSSSRATADDDKPVSLAVVTTGQFHLIPLNSAPGSASGGVVISVDTSVWNKEVLPFVDASGQTFALIDYSTMDPDAVPSVVSFYNGRLVSRYTLPPLSKPTIARDPADLPVAMVGPPPLVLTQDWRNPDPSLIPLPLPPYGFAAVTLTTVAGIAAVVWIVRRSALARGTAIRWSVLTALFGPAAPLTLLCLTRRPARVRCPTCAKRRVVDRDECEHCGAAFPPPGDAATAVFEDAGRTAA